MKFHLFVVLALCTTGLFAQSKKELAAEVARLNSENTSLKSELAELQKPKLADLSNDDKKASYALGILVSKNLKAQGGDSLDLESLVIGMREVFEAKECQLTDQEASLFVQSYMQQAMVVKIERAKKEGLAFLAENKTKEGVKETASGLQYKVIASGNGKKPTATDQVTVHYTGKLTDGTIFDSSVERGQPATFGVNEVIAGWTEVIQLMSEGDKWMVFLPSELGYGEQGAGGEIPPHSVLIFEIELIKVN